MLSESFNFTDLYVTPVPDSIYNRQPRCASAAGVYNNNGPLFPSDISTFVCDYDSEKDFRPRLVVPSEVRDLDSAWATCLGSLEGVYDPPVALKPATVIAVPTKNPEPIDPAPAEPATLTATPALATPPPPSTVDPTTRAPATASPEVPGAQPSPSDDNQPTHDPATRPSTMVGDGQASNGNNHPTVNPDNFPASTSTRNPGGIAASSVSHVDPKPPLLTVAQPDSDSDSDPESLPVPGGAQQPAKTRTRDALTVLSEALASIESPSRAQAAATHAGATAVGSQAVTTINVPSANGATVSWTSGGQTYTATRLGDSLHVEDSNGQSITVTVQTGASIGGQIITIVPGGIAVTSRLAANSGALVATWTSDGKTYTATRTGDSIRIMSSGGEYVILVGSDTASLDGHTFKVVAGSFVVDDVRTIAFSVVPAPTTSAAIWTDSGRTFSALQQDGNIIVIDGSRTSTLRPGSAMTVAGQVISAPPFTPVVAPVVILDGSTTLSLSALSTPSLSEQQVLTFGNHLVTLSSSGNSVLVYDDSSTITATKGYVVTIDGHVLSIPSENITGPLEGVATATSSGTAGATGIDGTYIGGANRATEHLYLTWAALFTAIICLLSC